MSIISNLKWRYATKRFDNSKKLTGAQINSLKEAFNLTALSYGLQTLKLVVVEDKLLREKLVPIAYGQKQVLEASHLLIICTQAEINETDVEKHFNRIIEVRYTPEEVLAPFKTQLNATINKMSVQEKEQWASKQAYIALGNLMTVCAAEYIDSCPMEGFVPQELDKVLGLDKHGLKSVLLLPVGFRASDDIFANFKKVRQPLETVVIDL